MIKSADFWIMILVGVAIGCSANRGRDLPELPAIALDSLSPQLRDAVEQRLRDVAQDPSDARANGQLGMLLHASDLLDSAQVLYRRADALSQGDGDFEWAYLLGVVEQRRGSTEQAIEAYQRTLARRSYAPAAIRLGECLAALDRPQEARVAFEDALQMDRSAAAAYYALGRTLLDLQEREEALGLLQRAAELAPQSGAVYYTLALAYREAGDEAAAERFVRLSTQHGQTKPAINDPIQMRVDELSADEHYYLNLGRGMEQRGELKQAIEAYQRALVLNPDMATAHANLVAAYGKMGEFEQAEAHYLAGTRIDASIEELHNNWGVLQAIRGDAAAAAEAFERALQINPQSADAHANLGVAQMQLGEAANGAAHLQSALQADPSNRSARLHLGRYQLQRGHITEAIPLLEGALDGADDHQTPLILQTLAEARLLAGREPEAIELAKRAIRSAESLGLEDLARQIETDFQSRRHQK